MLSFKIYSIATAFFCLGISPDFSFWGDRIKGSGNLVKETREVGSFTAVKITNHGNLYIEIGDRFHLEIEAEDNIQEYLQAKVKGDTLVIGKDRRSVNINPRKKMSYYLTVPPNTLKALIATSHGDIHCPALNQPEVRIHSTSHGNIFVETIEAQNVDITMTSHGDLSITSLTAEQLNVEQTSHGRIRIEEGRCGNLDLQQTSHGHFKATGLNVETADVHQTSHGLIKLSVHGDLTVRATSHGDIYYRGDPQTHIRAGKRATVKPLR